MGYVHEGVHTDSCQSTEKEHQTQGGGAEVTFMVELTVGPLAPCTGCRSKLLLMHFLILFNVKRVSKAWTVYWGPSEGSIVTPTTKGLDLLWHQTRVHRPQANSLAEHLPPQIHLFC